MISDYMKIDHRDCDALFAEAEKSVIDGDFAQAHSQFLVFSEGTLQHFNKEEQALFPTFEQVTGNSDGPTSMMRFEHEQMRGLLDKMTDAVKQQDKDAFLSVAESMMIMMQQHNMKEEQMLYTMCDRMIPADLKQQTLDTMQAM